MAAINPVSKTFTSKVANLLVQHPNNLPSQFICGLIKICSHSPLKGWSPCAAEYSALVNSFLPVSFIRYSLFTGLYEGSQFSLKWIGIPSSFASTLAFPTINATIKVSH